MQTSSSVDTRGKRTGAHRKVRICAIGLRAIPNTMGGIETYCENLYPRLVDGGFDVTVIARKPYCRAPRDFEGVRVIPIWALRHKYLETLIHTFMALIYARLYVHPDIVHLHAVGPGFFAPLARLLGFKTIVTHHSADYLRPKWGLVGRAFLRAGERMAALFANKVVCVNQSIRNDLVRRYRFAADRICTIRNGAPVHLEPVSEGADVLSALGIEKNAYLLAVGRLEATKGFHDLIEAFKRAAVGDMKLVIVGADFSDDAYARQLMSKASPSIIFAGARKGGELATLYRNTRVFIHPSYMEGFSLVTLEAIAAGAPVLMSDIDANREFELEDAAYFPVGDVDVLAAKIRIGPHGLEGAHRRQEVIRKNTWDVNAQRFAREALAVVGVSEQALHAESELRA